jgi:hypothetical protein
MAIETLGIPLAYIIVTALVLWMALTARGRWWIKALIIAAALLFGLALWQSLESLQGWPVEAPMPDRFEIVWTEAREDNRKTGRDGAVYVWARAITAADPDGRPFSLRLHARDPSEEPRLYKLPYSRGLHEQTEEIREKLAAGGRFFGFLGRGGEIGEGGPGGSGGGPGAGKGGEAIPGGGGEEAAARTASPPSFQDYVFHELPPPSFPEKEHVP